MPEPSNNAVTPPPSARGPESEALAPLRHPVFRMLWLAWVAANMCMWMNDVAAAWMMTSLSHSPALVALVQTASTAPVFLLGVPSGALADILDRRRFLIFTQFWVASVALVTCAVVVSGNITPLTLLALTFANGLGLAMRWPVFSAVVPELVPRPQLPAALALNGVAMNSARLAGPLVAGALLSSAGVEYVFVLNAVLSVITGVAIMRWRRQPKQSVLPGERFVGAMRVGVQHVAQSPRIKAVLVRVSLFFFVSAALTSLLPLIAKGMHGGGAGTYTLLCAFQGAGAITAALNLQRMRRRLSRDQLVRLGTVLVALATLVVAETPTFYAAAPAMFIAGGAWISAANSMGVSAQLALPDWVRARGMSFYQMSLMGGSALGAAFWGQVASFTSLTTSLLCAVCAGLTAAWLTRGHSVEGSGENDLSPAQLPVQPAATADIDPDAGPVLVTVEYRIDPARADEFRAVMRETRRARLAQGALSWELFQDVNDPGRFTEVLIDESWVEQLRRFNRFTAADLALRERRLQFHLGPQPPVVTRGIAQRVGR